MIGSKLKFKNKSKFYTLEGFISEDFKNYKKFTNNKDYVNPDVETRHLTCFSHYTWEKTNQRFMVVDL